MENLKITELIGRAPWREAVTYRKTWPHEYVLLRKDNQRELFDLVCARFRAGEEYVLNRAPLYRDRRDFVIQPGDTGKREDYPAKPAARV